MRYQTALRVIGKWLDERSSRGVTIFEVDDGFAVQWHWGDDVRTTIVRQFTETELMTMERAARHVKAAPGGGLRQSAPARANGYQDVLRAMGYEIDQVDGQGLILQEVEGGYLISYQYRKRAPELLWRKHMTVIPPSEQLVLLQEARRRRQVKTGLAARLS